MPNRILREGILDSDRVNKLTWEAEVFYRRLMSVVDDYGRFDARPEVLKSRCYPLRSERVREPDIIRWLEECELAGLISVYGLRMPGSSRWLRISELAEMLPLLGSGIGEKVYLLFHDLGSPRAKASKWPPPPSEAKEKPVSDGSQSPSAPQPASARTCAHMRAYVTGAHSSSSSSTGAGARAGAAPTPDLEPLPEDPKLARLFCEWRTFEKGPPCPRDEVLAILESLLHADFGQDEISAEINRKGRSPTEFPREMAKRLKADRKASAAPPRETKEQRDAKIAAQRAKAKAEAEAATSEPITQRIKNRKPSNVSPKE